jgi:hypothetical protein
MHETRRVRSSATRCAVASVMLAAMFAPAAGVAAPPAPPARSTPVRVPATGDVFGLDMASRENPGGSQATPATLALQGVGWMRITADWAQIEPARGAYAWAELDDQIHRVAQAGMRVLVLLENTPRWAALTPNEPKAVWSHQPPQRIADWTSFVTAATKRYGVRVAAWQVEPALGLPEFRGTTQDYREMLHAARRIIRRTDPSAELVAATPDGLDLPFIKGLLAVAGDDFDAVMLFPRGATPDDFLEALGAIRTRILTDTRHQLWFSALPEWGNEIPFTVTALAGGVSRVFWPRLDPLLTTTIHALGAGRFVGPLNRGPGVHAFVFTNGGSPVVAVWSTGAARAVPLATTGPLTGTTLGGQVLRPGGNAADTVPAGTEPVFVSNPAPPVVDEAARTAQQEGLQMPRDPAHDFSKASSVSAQLGTINIEHGLYNQRLRTLGAGRLVPVMVDGVEAVRTDQLTNAVYAYFDVDHSYAYFVDRRYNLLIAVEVHKASAPQRVGFNLFYDSTSGYKFTPWQWVDAGQGWVTYTFRITDPDFSSVWGWDFAVNGAGDKKENLVLRSASVTKVTGGP